MPKITFILPIYKVEAYLPRALQSIAAQTLPDWEAILVDDGSPDGCGAICDRAAEADARFRVLHQKNAGSGMARNAGLHAARGEFIHFLDPDDYVEPDFAERMVSLAEREGADIAMFGFYTELQRSDGSCERQKLSRPPVTGSFTYAEFVDVYPQFVTYHYNRNKLYRRSMLEKNGCRFSQHTLGQDSVFNVRTYAKPFARLVAVETPFIHYTVREGSSVNRYHEDRLRDNFYITREISRVVAGWGREKDAAFVSALTSCAIRDLNLGIKNACMSPLGLWARCRWLRTLMRDVRLRRAVQLMPAARLASRNDRMKLRLLKAHCYELVILAASANQRRAGRREG